MNLGIHYIQRGLTVKTNLCLAFSYLSGSYQFINNSLITIRLLKKIVLYSKKWSVIASGFSRMGI